MNHHIDKVTEYFLAGYNCSQALLMTYGSTFGLDAETAAKLGSGLGGGLGHTGHICGFISGAVLIIGLAEGNFDPNNTNRKLQTVEKVAAFLDDCRQILGNIECRELIQCDIRTREQLGKAMNEGKMNRCGTEFLPKIVSLLDEKYLNPK